MVGQFQNSQPVEGFLNPWEGHGQGGLISSISEPAIPGNANQGFTCDILADLCYDTAHTPMSGS